MVNLWFSEWKMLTRQRSYFSFLALWVSVFTLLFLLEGTNNSIAGFTNITATIMNIILYILPLFMMIIGSFSVTNEMENGQWDLLSTYPISIPSYLLGKLTGLISGQWAVFTLSFGVSMVIGLAAGIPLSLKWLFAIYFFSLFLIIMFLAFGILLGTIVKTRWKAFTITAGVWFFLIMIWPSALIALLSLVPYPMIGIFMKIAMVLNPAEFLRIFSIIKWDAGAVFGQSYDSIVQLYGSKTGWLLLGGYVISYLSFFLALSFFFLQRRRQQ